MGRVEIFPHKTSLEESYCDLSLSLLIFIRGQTRKNGPITNKNPNFRGNLIRVMTPMKFFFEPFKKSQTPSLLFNYLLVPVVSLYLKADLFSVSGGGWR